MNRICAILSPAHPIASGLSSASALTLSKLEESLGRWIPEDLFPKAADKDNSRDRVFTRKRTFWGMIWQALHPGESILDVVLQLKALLEALGGASISPATGGYCQARERLPLEGFVRCLAATARAADRLASPISLLKGRPIKVTDGTAITLTDTLENRQTYPPIQSPAKPAFPMMRMVVLFSLLSGTISSVACGALDVSELSLLASLSKYLKVNDILLGDRGFGCYPLIAYLKHNLGVDFIGRTTRSTDTARHLKELGAGDWLVEWKIGNTKRSPWLAKSVSDTLPKTMTLRLVKATVQRKGFRVCQIAVVTTLLDPTHYPAEEILEAYLRRWRLEICFNDIKTTLRLDFVRNRTPGMVQKEVLVRMVTHNLIRCTMALTASTHKVPLVRISFRSTLVALKRYSQALAFATDEGVKKRLWDALLKTLAGCLLPQRPGRKEPRAVKRRKNKYAKLNKPRHLFQDPPKRHARRSRSRLRKLGLI